MINPKKLTKTTQCFVDLNKNLIKFKGEALVEVKTEKNKVKTHSHYFVLIG